MADTTRASLLKKLREPFDLDEIELLPKYTGKKDANGKPPRESYKNCPECGGYHPMPSIHLSYVGHAGITNRLLDVDPEWTWEPLALNANGTPMMSDGGMWIRLTVLGITRIGFGDAQGKTGPNATKELIGDALRNAAMRFGVGTYLWSKSDKAKAELTRQGIDADDDDAKPKPEVDAKPQAIPDGAVSQPNPDDKPITAAQVRKIWATANEMGWDEKVVHTAVEQYGVADMKDLSGYQASLLIDRMEKARAKQTHVEQKLADEFGATEVAS